MSTTTRRQAHKLAEGDIVHVDGYGRSTVHSVVTRELPNAQPDRPIRRRTAVRVRPDTPPNNDTGMVTVHGPATSYFVIERTP